jgi:hypothetical protein
VLQLFTISVPANREGEARQLVTELAPGAQLTYSVGGTLKYELPTEQVGGVVVLRRDWALDPATDCVTLYVCSGLLVKCVCKAV